MRVVRVRVVEVRVGPRVRVRIGVRVHGARVGFCG